MRALSVTRTATIWCPAPQFATAWWWWDGLYLAAMWMGNGCHDLLLTLHRATASQATVRVVPGNLWIYFCAFSLLRVVINVLMFVDNNVALCVRPNSFSSKRRTGWIDEHIPSYGKGLG